MTAIEDIEAIVPPAIPPRSSGKRTDRRISRLLLWPAIVVTVGLTQLPFAITLWYSFQNWNLLRPSERGFVGFRNYGQVLGEDALRSSLKATILITGGSVLFSLCLGLLVAVLLNRPFRGRWLARTLLITPFLVMPAAAALIWKWTILDFNSGVINWILTTVGINPVAWNTDYPLLTIVMVLSWQFTPFVMLILLAGLQSQNDEVLEAAAIDGAGPFRTFVWITLPHLRQYIELAVLLAGITLLQVFDPVAIMTSGAGETKTLSYLLYERAFIGLDIGVAAAYGVITVLIITVVASIALRLLFRIFSAQGLR